MTVKAALREAYAPVEAATAGDGNNVQVADEKPCDTIEATALAVGSRHSPLRIAMRRAYAPSDPVNEFPLAEVG